MTENQKKFIELSKQFPTISENLEVLRQREKRDAVIYTELDRVLDCISLIIEGIPYKFSDGTVWAAKFLCTVYNPPAQEFNLHKAMMRWDSAHREAFASWAAAPFWC